MAISSRSSASITNDGSAIAVIAAQNRLPIVKATLRNLIRRDDVITTFRHIDLAISDIFRDHAEVFGQTHE